MTTFTPDVRASLRALDASFAELQQRRLLLEKNWEMRKQYEQGYYAVRASQVHDELLQLDADRSATAQRNARIIAEMDSMRTRHLAASKGLADARHSLAACKQDFLRNLQRTDPRWKEKVLTRKRHELAALEQKRKAMASHPSASVRALDTEIARLRQLIDHRAKALSLPSEERARPSKRSHPVSGEEEVERIINSIPPPQSYRSEEDARREEQLAAVAAGSSLKRGPAFLYEERKLSDIKEEQRSRLDRTSSRHMPTPPRDPSPLREASPKLTKVDSRSEFERMMEQKEATINRRDSEAERRQREAARAEALLLEQQQQQREAEAEARAEAEAQRKAEAKRKAAAAAKEAEDRRKAELRKQAQKEAEAARQAEIQRQAALARQAEIERQNAVKQALARQQEEKKAAQRNAAAAASGFGGFGEQEEESDLDFDNMFDSGMQREVRMTRAGGRIQRQQMGGENIGEQLLEQESYLRNISHSDKLLILKAAAATIERQGRGLVYDLEMQEDREVAEEQREVEYIRIKKQTSEGAALTLLANLCLNICKEGYENKIKNEDLITTSAQIMQSFVSPEVRDVFLAFVGHLLACVPKKLVAQKDIRELLLWAFVRSMDQETRNDVRQTLITQMSYVFNCYVEDELEKREVEKPPAKVVSPVRGVGGGTSGAGSMKGTAGPSDEMKQQQNFTAKKPDDKLPQAQGALDIDDDEDEDEEEEEEIDENDFLDSWIEKNEDFS